MFNAEELRKLPVTQRIDRALEEVDRMRDEVRRLRTAIEDSRASAAALDRRQVEQGR